LFLFIANLPHKHAPRVIQFSFAYMQSALWHWIAVKKYKEEEEECFCSEKRFAN